MRLLDEQAVGTVAWRIEGDPLDDVLWVEALAADGRPARFDDRLDVLLSIYLARARPRAMA